MIVITVNQPGSDPDTQRFEIDRIRIGREVDNDLVLESDSCSRYHAEILFGRGLYKIVDLNSTNGISVNEQKVQEQLIANGDSIEIGVYTLGVSIPQKETPKTTMMPTVDAEPKAEKPEPEAPPKVLYLNRLLGKGGERSLKIADGVEYTIGRSPGADMVVDDAQCSGRHAMVFLRGDRCKIRDLDSANGTFVNREQVDEAEIRPGDRLTLGRTEFAVSDQPSQTDDQEILLARTQRGFPIPGHDQSTDRDGASGVGRGLRWGLAALAIVALLVIAAVVTWRLARFQLETGAALEGRDATSQDEVMVQVEPVEYKELVFSVAAAGTVTPQRRVTVSAEVGARVLSSAVGEGSPVRAGQQLVRLDDREIRLQIQEASSSVSREQVDLAKADFERKERLFADGAVTRSTLDQAKNHYLSLDSAYRSAQARIAQLRERAAKTGVASPLTGVVAQLLVEPGEFVGPGTPLAVIEDTEEVLVVVEVADRDVVRLRPLQVVEATTDAYQGRVFQGVIERVGSVANPVTRSFEVEARIGNPESELRSGMITSIRILLDKRRCLVVPAAALLDEREGEARVLLVSNGTARSVEVGIGNRQDRDVELVQGLAEGDEIVVYGHDQVRDGQSVTTAGTSPVGAAYMPPFSWEQSSQSTVRGNKPRSGDT
jgi:membrane fusion protein (multidrug efflux system)